MLPAEGIGMDKTGREDLVIRWRVSLRTDAAGAYDYLSTAVGRERFWAEEAPERDGHIHFRFSDGSHLRAKRLECAPPHLFSLRYFDGNVVRFLIEEAPGRGCHVTVEEHCASPEQHVVNSPGWVSVLLALKAAVNHGVDIRNHDPGRTWANGFVGN